MTRMEQMLKILLLEDSSIDAELIQRLLQKEKSFCKFFLAMSKEAFLQGLTEFHPDVIISDNSLPRFNASEALLIVQQRHLSIPFILVTGTVSEQYAADIIKQGADDYILKDRMTRLPAAIDAAVARHQVEKEKQHAFEQLRQSEENLKAIFDNSSEGFILLDEKGIVKVFNESASGSISAIANENISAGKSIFDFMEFGRHEYFETILTRVLNGETIQYDRSFTNNQEKITWINFSFNPVRKDHEIRGVCITARDITDKKLAEQQREFDHNNLNALINNTRDLLWSVDREMKLITCNQAFNDAVRLLSGTTLEKGADVLQAGYNNEQVQRYRQYYARAFSGESFTETEYISSPVEWWSEISFYPIYEKGNVIGTACFSRDITDRKKAEQVLRRMEQERLEQKVEEQKKITRAMLRTQEKERNAIGTELHDNVNQILVGTKLSLAMARNKPEKYSELVLYSMDQLQQAIEENRKIAHAFVAPDLETKSLVIQLQDLAATMFDPAGIRYSFAAGESVEESLDAERRLNIYRIAQEHCTNIIKYAKATDVQISLIKTIDSFRMVISDNGEGANTSKQQAGIGFRNIGNRLNLFNGTMNIITAPGKGFTLEISIPA